MKIISEEEGQKWLQVHNLPIEGGELRIFYKNSMVYYYTQTAGNIIHLAQFVADCFKKDEQECALWITAWGFLPDWENMNLFIKFRKGLNEERTIRQAPFHIFDKNERDDVESLMNLVMFNTWDTYLILPNHGIVFSPNDEFLHVSCKDEKDFQKFKFFFEAYKFKDITDYWNKHMAKAKEERLL